MLKKGVKALFKFRFVLDKFQKSDARGPTITPNVRAKWLTKLCPPDLQIAFAPNSGEIPMYDSNKIKLVSKEETGWWNHYFLIRNMLANNKIGWSYGPNIDEKISVNPKVPLVCNSVYQKNLILKAWSKHQADLIHIIPNIIDREVFYPEQRSKKITVGWIGYDVDYKRVKGAEVIPYLARKFPEIQFEMVHAIKPRYMNEWLPKKLPNLKIYYEIPHNKMAGIIRKWHVLVSGSKTETGGTHIKEAMACGVPVIASSFGAMPEIASSQILLKDLQTKLLPGNRNARYWTTESLEKYASALTSVLGSPSRQKMLAAAAIEESKKSDPHIISKKWFNFIYMCRDLSK